MKLFVISLENRPGALATVLGAIAGRGVNITTGGGGAYADGGAIALHFDDDDGARVALTDVGAGFQEVPAVVAWLEPDPGTLADAARRLGAAGVNIEGLAPYELADGRIGVVFGVDDPVAAAAALGDDLVPTRD